jgi:hypothetical protein
MARSRLASTADSYATNGTKDGFEVIAGKSVLEFRRDDTGQNKSSKCFGFVQSYDDRPKRRLFELLKSQGMQENQQVVFLSDGGEDVRNLQFYLNPQAEHLLDWFHVTMRLSPDSDCQRPARDDRRRRRTTATAT